MSWYFRTALLCSFSVLEKWCAPSSRVATKYRYFTAAGATAAAIERLPGLAMGPGGKPAWR